MSQRSYAVIGLGAVGGYYGARLASAGHEVHFVVRSDHDHLRREGLRMESPEGDVVLPAGSLSVHRGADTVPPVDVVLVAVKTTNTGEVLDTVRSLAADGAAVVAMQNGLGVEDTLAEALADRGPDAAGRPVLGAMCFICSNKVGPGHIRHLDYGRVTVGERTADHSPAGVTVAVAALVDDLRAAGVKAEALTDLDAGRWKKLVWNVPYNGLSVVLDAGTDELMADPTTRALVESIMHEVLDGAAACGKPIDPSFVQQMLTDTERMIPYATSMKLDHDAGRPMEIDAIYAAPLAAARAAGVELPLVWMLHDQLRFLDARNRRLS